MPTDARVSPLVPVERSLAMTNLTNRGTDCESVFRDDAAGALGPITERGHRGGVAGLRSCPPGLA